MEALARTGRSLFVLQLLLAVFLHVTASNSSCYIHTVRLMSRRLALLSLPPDLVTAVTEKLDLRSLAKFAAASAACQAAAQHELRVALRAAVKRCLVPGRSCRGMDALVKSPAFRLPDDLIAIPAGAFMHCDSLSELMLPVTVTTIGNGAFWGCSSLRVLQLPAALTKIGTSAFMHCTSLTSLRLPASVTTIGPRAFSGCTKLTKVALSTDLANIGEMAFNNCCSLVEFALPAGGFTREPTCPHSAFHGCSRSLSQSSIGRRVRLLCASCDRPCEVFTSGPKEFLTRVQCPHCNYYYSKISELEKSIDGLRNQSKWTDARRSAEMHGADARHRRATAARARSTWHRSTSAA